MNSKPLVNFFEASKELIYKYTHEDPAKMLIIMGALGFALSSAAQCFAIKINDKVDNKKKKFMLVQEAADGAVNIGLYLGITSSIWKISDKLIGFLRNKNIQTEKIVKKPKLNTRNHIKLGGRIFTTMAASVLACNIITPYVRNIIAGKLRKYYDSENVPQKCKKCMNSVESKPSLIFKSFNNWAEQNKKTVSGIYNYPSLGYSNNNRAGLKI